MRRFTTSDFDFALPHALIAQRPSDRRDESRLMIIDRATGHIAHGTFRDLLTLIPPGDVLAVNRSRVLRARLIGRRHSGGAAEVFLLKPITDSIWQAFVYPGAKLGVGKEVVIHESLRVQVVGVRDDGSREVRLDTPLMIDDAIERFGHLPLPPYIKRDDEQVDDERYQTVYARELGSVAAPTAGLHFSTALIDALGARGVRRAELLLHVGAGTFRPVSADDPSEHVMHAERYEVDEPAARTLNESVLAGGRIWAVGTTSVRTLESVYRGGDVAFVPERGETSIFIRPGYTFRAVHHMITNFHLPKSTLIMLVAAFAGYDLTMEAYRRAIESEYRFYSYGDAMAIL